MADGILKKRKDTKS